MADIRTDASRTTSLWLDRADPIPSDRFEPGEHFDLVVAGAGLTGLTTALLFARAGMRVAVIESRYVGAAATGNTTAKLSLLQGSHLSDILRHTTVNTAQAYVDGNREGMEWLLRYCADHDVAVQRRTAYSYAASPDGVGRVDEEYRAGVALGLDVTREQSIDVPFPQFGAVALHNQAQFDPMDVLATLASDLRSHGGSVVQGVRVTRVRPGDPSTVTTDHGEVFADKVVLATGTPFMDRGLYFVKQKALRSYALAFRTPGRLPDGMFLSVDSPSRSVRSVPGSSGSNPGASGNNLGATGNGSVVDAGELLLVGGNGHPVGRHPSPLSQVNDLVRWTERYFPGAERTHSWSAQDYEPAGRIPFVGWMPRSRGQVYFASGYDKWGMTNAIAASLTLSSDILGGSLPWAATLHRRITTPMDAGSFIGGAAAVAVYAVRGYVTALTSKATTEEPAEGTGSVAHAGVLPIGVSTTDGQTCTVSAVCPHLYGVLGWNDSEKSWDCPLHGSRFSAEGVLLEGPATRDLRRLS